MGSVIFDVEYVTAEDFFRNHPDVGPGSDHELLTKLLDRALCNKDVPSRLTLANLFLDWGADPTKVDSEKSNVLHTVVSRLRDPAAEAPLFKRLMDMGADPNLRSPRYGTPLEYLLQRTRLHDPELAPIYDVFFARPDLDFTVADKRGDTVWDKMCRVGTQNMGVTKRVNRYIVEHTGSPPPKPQGLKRQPDGSWLRFESPYAEQDANGYWYDPRFTQDSDGTWHHVEPD